MTYKRGKVYWYKFMWHGQLIRESTKQGNDKVARQMEAAHRASLAKGLVGIREKKPVPTLDVFCKRSFWPWVEGTFTKKSKTWWWYKNSTDRLLDSQLSGVPLDRITGESVAGYVARRKNAGLQVSSINAELRVIRRILRLAIEWGEIERAASVKMLTGERRREHVVTQEEEESYLEKATEPLASVAPVLVETGLRPEECFRLRWEFVNWNGSRYGKLFVTHGKTKAARRWLPMTQRVSAILQFRWEAQDRPVEGWIWPAETRSGHIEPSSLKGQHLKAIKASQGKVRPFVLYSLRHTFLTRLGESGCDAWTLARIAGHSSIEVSSRYVHSSEDAVNDAMRRLGGHSFGHNQILGKPAAGSENRESALIGRG